MEYVLNQMYTNSHYKRVPVDATQYYPRPDSYESSVAPLNVNAEAFVTKSELFSENKAIQAPTVHFSIVEFHSNEKFVISIPTECVSKVIGGKGKCIDYIRKQSHCHITVDEPLDKTGPTRNVKVMGSTDEMIFALYD